MRMSGRLLAVALCAALAVVPLTACSKSSAAAPATIRIGTLPTEDSLPLWLAERDGLFKKAGLKVEIQSFQSAQERDAALTANSIDGFMGDPVAVAALRAGGVPVRAVTIMLGATPKEGRFGIVVPPTSKATSLEQLANVEVGTSSDTIQEYVLDGLMGQAGVAGDQIKKAEVKKVPIRFELLMKGQLKAAALPEPFLSLAVKQGAKLVASDTEGVNLSQTMLIFSEKYLDRPEGAEAVEKLLGVWDEAVAEIDKDPSAYRSLLVEKARLPKPLETSYEVNTYPKHQLPSEDEVGAVLDWMKGAGLLSKSVTYADLIWKPAE